MKLILTALFLSLSLAHGQSTAFTYQGRLNNNGSPFTGNAEFQPTLWDAVTNGTQIAANSPAQLIVPVTNGLFTLPLDFGANFPGANRWLQLEVRTTIEPFALLSPRQPLTPTPYAITASNLTGTLPAGQLSGSIPSARLAGSYTSPVTVSNVGNIFVGNGAGLTSLNAGNISSGTLLDARIDAAIARDTEIFPAMLANDGPGSGLNADLLDGLDSTNFWKTSGNSGTTPGTHFLGTTDDQALELKVNGQRAMRLVPHTNGPNVIGGKSDNTISAGVTQATIAGGTGNNITANRGTVAGGRNNQVRSDSGTVGGGDGNIINEATYGSTIAGGGANYIWFTPGVTSIGFAGMNSIGGGIFNRIMTNADFSTIAGGDSHYVNTNADYAAIGGGQQNQVGTNVTFATIPGGQNNAVNGNYGFAAGRRAKANHQGAFVWADSQNADFASTATDQFLIRASGGVGIGTTLPYEKLHVRDDLAGGLTFPVKVANEAAATPGTAVGILFQTDDGPDRGKGALVYVRDNTWNRGNFHFLQNQAGDNTLAGTNHAVMTILNNGNVGIGNTSPTNKLHVNGGVSATAFVNTSDRNAKENFSPVDSRDVLDKVVSLPITRWNFKELKDGSHVGPMAQDFYAAFGLGSGETTITTLDADGVALAAIQGLNQKLESTEKRVKEKEDKIAALEKRLRDLEQLVSHRANQE